MSSSFSGSENVTAQSGIMADGLKSMFMSTLSFAMANVFVKQVSHLPAMEVVFFRCLVGVTFCWIGLRRAGADWKGSNRTKLLLRGFFGTTALYFFFITVQNIPLASAMTIQYLSPVFTTIIAIFLLKEKVRLPQWFFYALAFSGVLLIDRFDPRISIGFLLMGILSAFCSGMAYNLVRSLREREHPLTVVLHFQLFGMVAGFFFTIFNWQMPTRWDWLFLFLIGLFSQLGQIFLTNALQREKASNVVIVTYTGLVYGLSIGWLVFGEAQTVESIIGMLLVVLGVLASIMYTRRRVDPAEIEVTHA